MSGAVTVYRLQMASAIRLSLANRADFIAQVAGMLVNNVFVMAMWFMFFAGFRRVGGWQMHDVVLLMGMVMVIVGGANVFAGGYRDMAARIQRGEIDGLLTQPQPVLLRLIAADSMAHGFGDFFTGIGLLAFGARLALVDVPMLLVVLACGFTVFLSCGVVFASLSFWIRGARSLARDLVDFVILFSMYPGSIWSGGMKLVIYSLLPAGFIVLMPVRLLRAFDVRELMVLLVVTLGYASCAAWVFNTGLRRYRRGYS